MVRLGGVLTVSRAAQVKNADTTQLLRGFVTGRAHLLGGPSRRRRKDLHVNAGHGTQTKDLLEASLDEALTLLDVDRRAWIVGVAHLSDLPLDHPVPDLNTIGAVFGWAREQGLFPTGALNYVADADATLLAKDIVTMTFRHKDSDGGDFLEVMVGFGAAGFVALGMTRTGNLGRERGRPADVLVTDVEAACLDLGVIGTLTAQMLGYTGPIDMGLSLSDQIPGRPLCLRSFDEAGELRPPSTEPTPSIRIVRARFTAGDEASVRFGAVYEMLLEAIAPFGVTGPEFVTDARSAIDYDVVEGQYTLPAELRATRA